MWLINDQNVISPKGSKFQFISLSKTALLRLYGLCHREKNLVHINYYKVCLGPCTISEANRITRGLNLPNSLEFTKVSIYTPRGVACSKFLGWRKNKGVRVS